jgi:hypothetical protein
MLSGLILSVALSAQVPVPEPPDLHPVQNAQVQKGQQVQKARQVQKGSGSHGLCLFRGDGPIRRALRGEGPVRRIWRSRPRLLRRGNC